MYGTLDTEDLERRLSLPGPISPRSPRSVRIESWEEKLKAAIHSKKVEVVLALLLVVDVICLVVELVLDARYPPCPVIMERCVVESPLVGKESAKLSCRKHEEWFEKTHQWLYGISIFVLLVFALEMALLILATGMKFFSDSLYVLDFIVVTTSLYLELALRDQLAKDAGGALIMVRLWRLVRIGHGVFTDTHEYDKHAYDEMTEQILLLKAENRSLRRLCATVAPDSTYL